MVPESLETAFRLARPSDGVAVHCGVVQSFGYEKKSINM